MKTEKEFRDATSRLQNKLDIATSTIRIIRTWASFRKGIALEPEATLKLCDRTLEELNK